MKDLRKIYNVYLRVVSVRCLLCQRENHKILKKTLFYITLIFLLLNFTHIKTLVSCQHNNDQTRISISMHTNQAQISFLTLNTWFPPLWIPSNNQAVRLKNLLDSLQIVKFDIICLQEVYKSKVQEQIMKSISTKYYFHNHRRYEKKFIFFNKNCNGGLLTLSKYPIVSEQFVQFPLYKKMKYDEKIGGKGFLVSTINLPSGDIVVINTHLYAGRKEKDANNRLKQIQFLLTFIETSPQLVNKPIILLGDFNITHPSLLPKNSKFPDKELYKTLTDLKGFNEFIEQVNENDFTYDIVTNKYANLWYNRFEGRQKFDYIFYKPTEHFKGIEYKILFKGKDILSDHYGVNMTVKIPPYCKDFIDGEND